MAWCWRQKLGTPECTYLVRWVADFWFFSIRIHHWLSSDDQRYMHDHPWFFVTLIISGGYTEWTPTPIDEVAAMGPRVGKWYGRWSLLKRAASWKHTVETKGAWTILLTGRNKRRWGFWVNGKLKRRDKFFSKYGHHQCE